MPASPVKANSGLARWPGPDREAWQQACRAAEDPFASQPRIAGWSESTRRQARASVTRFIAWLCSERPTPTTSIADCVDRDVLARFVQYASKRIKLTSVRTQLFYVLCALETFQSQRDWSREWQLYWRVNARAKRELPGKRPLVHGRALFELGIGLMQGSSSAADLNEARSYRNGLVVALLAAAPMRISNFAAIRINHHLRQDDGRWSISLDATETKTRAADCWPLESEICSYLERYLYVVRPMLLSKAGISLEETDRLWIGDSGRPVGAQILRRWINAVTEVGIGVRICPHTFRHCAATTFSVERPSRSVEAAALLGHASPETTERHYIIQQRQIAQRDYLDLLAERRRKANQTRVVARPGEALQ